MTPPAAPHMTRPSIESRDLAKVSFIAEWGLRACAVIWALGAGQVVWLRLAAGKVSAGELLNAEDVDRVDSWANTLQGAQILALVVVGAAFAVWLFGASRNIDAVGGTRQFASIWAFGSWFVPIVNLGMPALMVRDVWHAGVPKEPRIPRLVAAWWATFLVMLISGRVFVGAIDGVRPGDTSAVSGASLFGGVHVLSALAAAVLGSLVVAQATARLDAARLGSAPRWPSRVPTMATIALALVAAVATTILFWPEAATAADRQVESVAPAPEELGQALVEDLRVGDCFLEPNDATVSGYRVVVTLTRCQTPGAWRVYHVGHLPYSSQSSFPGYDPVWEEAIVRCIDIYEFSLGEPWDTDRWDIDAIFPPSDRWRMGERWYTCLRFPYSDIPVAPRGSV